ncbi:sigma-54-dependent Fis family transcriptional regulator (plasmid) [Photobacterium sp. GJ3]|uniref:sigma-54-dependent Fis family transcriptional regulator n=1 Tax=Photobacterium sp. GJ3 TaxID=2829502 RepID=UPI001B8BC27D|nr:sigma-54-dependent Fis family transcriptional regulator [Photobacterium sp. GJ3]QUJ69808.1 sigma-54-dependent Fis family transcriptional regulator [Photobacterium sp. GJ3]
MQEDKASLNGKAGQISRVADSWQRCRGYGLDCEQAPVVTRLSSEQWQQRMAQSQQMVSVTRDKVLPMYQRMLHNSNSLVLLTDSQGYLLERWGAPPFCQQLPAELLTPGACWQEKAVGTNAIGTVLQTQAISDVQCDEHFLAVNRMMSASASPIFDANRRLVGVLNVSSDAYLPTTLVHGMAKVMAQAIENQMISAAYQQHFWQLMLNTSPDNLDSQWAGLLVFNAQGQILVSNQRANALLGQSLQGLPIETVTGQPLATLLAWQAAEVMTVKGPEAIPLFARIIAPHVSGETATLPMVTAPGPTTLPSGDARVLTDLDTGDKHMARAVDQALRVVHSDIPLLIQGETGVGKEIFVRAFHASSARHDAELVAVNCAAIPSELVEAELFGYVKGAFTGASPKGSIGLIRRADQGTLFLDEIGDMPLSTQARLLRVLQDKCVTPLGSSERYPVDFRLVCATHQPLREAIQRRQFREDLYYRMNGLTVSLPPLKDRQDLPKVVEAVLAELADNGLKGDVSEEVMQLFLSHLWPGNIRQLFNVLRVAVVLAGDQRIQPEHLPDDFFWDLKGITREADLLESDLLEDDWQVALPKVYKALGRNVSKTAEAMGVSRNTVYKRLKQLGLWHDG